MEEFQLKDVVFYQPSDQQNFQWTIQQYLSKTQIAYFFTEMTKFLLRRQGVQASSQIFEFTQQYIKGEHVLLKSYTHFQNMPMNKICFIINLGKVFNMNEDKVGYDFNQLLKLLCSDFPKLLVLRTLRMIKNDYSSTDDTIFQNSYNGDYFLRSFFINLVYEEFLSKVKQHLSESSTTENFAQFLHKLYLEVEDQPLRLPQMSSLYEILLKYSPSGSQKVSSPILPFSPSMMLNSIKDGTITYDQFYQELYQSKTLEKHITDQLNEIDTVINKTKDITKLMQEKNEDLFPHDIDGSPIKKKFLVSSSSSNNNISISNSNNNNNNNNNGGQNQISLLNKPHSNSDMDQISEKQGSHTNSSKDQNNFLYKNSSNNSNNDDNQDNMYY